MQQRKTVHDIIKDQSDTELIASLRLDLMTDDYEMKLIREALSRILEKLKKP